MTDQTTNFSEADLNKQLAVFPSSKLVAFAASCAERLMPAYTRYSEKAKLVPSTTLLYRGALDEIWNCALGYEISRQAIEDMEKACLDAIPTEEETLMYSEPYAEDACAAVIFAIRAWLSSAPQEAVWAARRVYDALDNYVIRSVGILESEEQILAHPLIQKELLRQKYDLEQLESKMSSTIEQSTIKELRARSQKQAFTVFE